MWSRTDARRRARDGRAVLRCTTGGQNFLYSVHMQPSLIFQTLVLLALANGTPVIAKSILGARFAIPIDKGVKFIDGRPILGSSKTVRGIFLSILVTSVFAPVLGLSWRIGVLVASVAMAGDLASSFLKRRINLPAGGKATGLDQVPESLFPLPARRGALSLTALDILAAVCFFLSARYFFHASSTACTFAIVPTEVSEAIRVAAGDGV